jgi:hypothetical protein
VSHFTKVATKINNLTALFKALEKMNLKYTTSEQGVEVRGYKGQKLAAEVSINMGKYDIGVVKAEDGNYTLVSDWWGVETTRGVTEHEFVEELNKEYAYARVVQACEEQGYTIQAEDIQQNEDGTVKLVATKWG